MVLLPLCVSHLLRWSCTLLCTYFHMVHVCWQRSWDRYWWHTRINFWHVPLHVNTREVGLNFTSGCGWNSWVAFCHMECLRCILLSWFVRFIPPLLCLWQNSFVVATLYTSAWSQMSRRRHFARHRHRLLHHRRDFHLYPRLHLHHVVVVIVVILLSSWSSSSYRRGCHRRPILSSW